MRFSRWPLRTPHRSLQVPRPAARPCCHYRARGDTPSPHAPRDAGRPSAPRPRPGPNHELDDNEATAQLSLDLA
jgi:hypothetical protein